MNKIIGVALCLALFACSSADKKDKQSNTSQTTKDSVKTNPFENLEKGKILILKCKADTSNNYALYIPASYNSNKPSPVIYFFDAHAAGSLPLNKYKALSEKYGYLFAGSNNSKNGNTGEVNGAFASNMMNDLQARLNIDKARIYTSGFSGGSRVAAGVAIFRGGVNTVIGIGAGLPNLEKQIENPFNYVGIAGNEDFNYNELVDLEDMFSKSPIEHTFISFNGKHEWCPVDIMNEAMMWLEFKAMKQSLIPKNDSLVNSFVTNMETKLNELIKKKKEPEALELAKRVISFTNGLTNTEKLNTTITQLEKSDAIKKDKERKLDLASAEKGLKEQYMNAMQSKDENWWRTEVAHMNDSKKFPADQLAMNKRILSYLSLACYMGITQMLKANQIKEAEHFIILYKTIDPTNPEAPYLQATIYLTQNQDDKAIAELKNAAKLGFKEYDRFTKDFQKYTTLVEVEKIAAEIQDNAKKE